MESKIVEAGAKVIEVVEHDCHHITSGVLEVGSLKFAGVVEGVLQGVQEVPDKGSAEVSFGVQAEDFQGNSKILLHLQVGPDAGIVTAGGKTARASEGGPGSGDTGSTHRWECRKVD